MHGYTIELVTNLLLPASYDVRSLSASMTGMNPLPCIDIVDGDDYEGAECVSRLKTAKQHPNLNQFVLSDISLNPNIIGALEDLVRSNEMWDAIYIEFCQGDLAGAISAVLSHDNVRKLEITGTLDSRCFNALSFFLTTKSNLVEIALLVHMNGEQAESLVRSLPNSQVRCLRLIKSRFEENALQCLMDFFLQDVNIETIQFDRCDNNISMFLDAIACGLSLQNLEVTGDLCDLRLQTALSKILRQKRIKRLTLGQSVQPAEAVSFSLNWMVPDLTACNSLNILDLSGTFMDDNCLLTLIDCLCFNDSVQELRLHENRVSNTGAKAFGLSLPKMRGLHRVFLHRNCFEEEGAEAILDGIRKNHNILECTIPTMGRNIVMSKYQRLISFETCLNSGIKKALRDKAFPLSLWPLVMERSGRHLWTPYCEYQMTSSESWKFMQQIDSIFLCLVEGRVKTSEC
jgi:hypothetical protein